MIVLGQQLIYATYKGGVNCLESTYFFFRSVWFPQILCFSYVLGLKVLEFSMFFSFFSFFLLFPFFFLWFLIFQIFSFLFFRNFYILSGLKVQLYRNWTFCCPGGCMLVSAACWLSVSESILFKTRDFC